MQRRSRCLKVRRCQGKSSRWETKGCHCRRRERLSRWHQLNRFLPSPTQLQDHQGRFRCRPSLREDHRRLQALHLGHQMRDHQGHHPMMLSLREQRIRQYQRQWTGRLLLQCWLQPRVLLNHQLQC